MDKTELLKWVIEQINGYRMDLMYIRSSECPSMSKETIKMIKTNAEAFQDILRILMREPEEEPVLDDVELGYLKNVIRPFKDECIYVKKSNPLYCQDEEYIFINLKCGGIALPDFKKGTMYINMEPNKKYTLEELGLFYDK